MIPEAVDEILQSKIGGITVVNLFRIMKEKIPITTLIVVEKMAYYTIIFIGFMVALPYVGFSLSGLLVAGGILGIVIGFASQTVVSNFISGIFLLIEKPMKVGDGVNIGDVSGVVESPTIFVEELGESSVNITIKVWAPSSHWYGVYTEMLWKIKVALEKEGIEIPFPQRVVHMAK